MVVKLQWFKSLPTYNQLLKTYIEIGPNDSLNYLLVASKDHGQGDGNEELEDLLHQDEIHGKCSPLLWN